MSLSTNAVDSFHCSVCQQLLEVTPNSGGKKCQCPACGNTMQVPHSAATAAENPVVAALADGQPQSQTDPVPFGSLRQTADASLPQIDTGNDAPGSPFPQIDTGPQRSISQIARDRAEADLQGGDSFHYERAAFNMGITGGLLMMGIAVVWFVVGLAGGFIFFYPPILFVIGLFALFKGVLDGNVSGNRRRTRRY